MDIKALRQKVLDLAIRGKLVPQNPDDEPASVLLEKIRQEKEQMVKEGKLKKKDIKDDTVIFKDEDGLYYEQFKDGKVKCIDDEIPFEVPEGWEWCRLTILCKNVQYGVSKSAESSGTCKLLRITDIQGGNVNWNNVPYVTIEEYEDYLLEKGDILFARTGATVGKSFLITTIPYNAIFASYLIRIQLFKNLNPKYIYRFFNSKCYWKLITSKAVGIGQPNCNGTSLKQLFIPLPPLKEQQRIVKKLEEILKKIDILEHEKEEAQSLTKLSKNKLLDLAIRGQLVPQDTNDEPASVLLEKIKEEKEQLVKEGKLKPKDIKNDTIIFKGEDGLYYEQLKDGKVKCIDDEIPFEIPEGWEYEKMGNIFFIARGASPRPIEKFLTTDSKGINWIKIGDTEKGGKYITSTKEKIILEGAKKSRYVKEGDFLLTNSMSFGRPYILKTNGCIHDGWLVISSGNIRINTDYLYYLLSSKIIYNLLTQLAAGSTVKNLKSDTVKSLLIPIPPLNEQQRIVEKLEQLFAQIDTIETALQ